MSHFKETMQVKENNLKEMFKIKIAHNPSDGRFREDLVKTVLDVIPQKYSIGNGFVVDSRGVLSKEIDLIIYDDVYVPRFFINTYSVIPIESVVAIIQVKTSLNSTQLSSTIDNLNSIDSLQAVKGGKIISAASSIIIEEERMVVPLKILVCGSSDTELTATKCSDIDIVYAIEQNSFGAILVKDIDPESIVSNKHTQELMLKMRKNNTNYKRNINNKLFKFSLSVMKYLTLINNSMIVNYDAYSKGADDDE